MHSPVLWYATAALLASSAAFADCRLENVEVRTDGVWQAKLVVTDPGWQLAGVAVHERGTDVVLQVRTQERTAISDVAPTRYATERALMILHGPAEITASARGYADPISARLDASALCVRPADSRFWPLVWWQAMVALVVASDDTKLIESRMDARRRALTVAEQFQKYAQAAGADATLVAGALHVQGYLLARIGQHARARDRLTEATKAWRDAGDAGASAAAQFESAKEMLALGNAGAALEALQPLLSARTQRNYPGIAVWAKNDRCAALRNTNRREEAIACFANLVPQLDALGERKEAANALCNWGSALGTAGRWAEARERIQQCGTRRAALGAPMGMAHAQLLLGWLALETGTVDEAVAYFGASLEHARRAGNAGAIWDAQLWLAQAWLDGDELARAHEAIEQIEPDETQDSARKAQWHFALAHLALYADDTAAASLHFRAAWERFSSSGQAAAALAAHCQWALIDTTLPISPDCDPLIGALAHRRRGGFEAATRLLQVPQIGADREIFRRFLRQVDDRDGMHELQAIVAQAQSLSQESPAARAVRGQLLARMAFELAVLAQRDGSEAYARLALECATKARGGTASASGRLAPAKRASPPIPAWSNFQATPIEPGSVLIASTSQLGMTYLVVGRQSGTRVVSIQSARLADATRRWRDAIAQGSSADEQARDYSALLQVDNWLLPSDRRVVLALHGPMATVPWSALAIPGDTSFGYRPLVEQSSVVQLAAAASAVRCRPHAKQIAFFPRKPDPGLPGAMIERDVVASLADRAGWTIVAKGAPGLIVHIASHAKSDEIDFRRNALLVSGPAGPSTLDYPSELVRDARLVVLAGCETGLGPLSRWTSATSLARRTLDDGASAALAHLWPIEDAAAARLHAEFYRALLDGQSEDAALATAQRELLRQRTTRVPVRWASPVLLVREDSFFTTGRPDAGCENQHSRDIRISQVITGEP